MNLTHLNIFGQSRKHLLLCFKPCYLETRVKKNTPYEL